MTPQPEAREPEHLRSSLYTDCSESTASSHSPFFGKGVFYASYQEV